MPKKFDLVSCHVSFLMMICKSRVEKSSFPVLLIMYLMIVCEVNIREHKEEVGVIHLFQPGEYRAL